MTSHECTRQLFTSVVRASYLACVEHHASWSAPSQGSCYSYLSVMPASEPARWTPQVGRHPPGADAAPSPMFALVQEMEVECLDQWQQRRGELFANPEFQAMIARRPDLFGSGVWTSTTSTMCGTRLLSLH
jgi:hypothetical protein